MPYQYGMQTSPSGGNGLGGLPKKQTTPQEVSYTSITPLRVPGFRGTIVPPANAKYMRVAVIGGGGGGRASNSNFGGGGGGGCAASKLVPACPISYTLGAGGAAVAGVSAIPTAASNGGDSTAIFAGRVLVGGGGTVGGSGAGQGGIGSGGDYNHSGGAGLGQTSTSGGTGGGAAGPNGAGGAGVAGGAGGNSTAGLVGLASGPGWGAGGGQGGNTVMGTTNGHRAMSGGGGTGVPAGAVEAATTQNNPLLRGPDIQDIWGRCSASGTSNGTTTPTSFTSAGGEMGGGGIGVFLDTYTATTGGVGGIVVEWFYD